MISTKNLTAKTVIKEEFNTEKNANASTNQKVKFKTGQKAIIYDDATNTGTSYRLSAAAKQLGLKTGDSVRIANIVGDKRGYEVSWSDKDGIEKKTILKTQVLKTVDEYNEIHTAANGSFDYGILNSSIKSLESKIAEQQAVLALQKSQKELMEILGITGIADCPTSRPCWIEMSKKYFQQKVNGASGDDIVASLKMLFDNGIIKN